MAVIKAELRPKKADGTYTDIIYPRTSVDMVDGIQGLYSPSVISKGTDLPVEQRVKGKMYFKEK